MSILILKWTSPLHFINLIKNYKNEIIWLIIMNKFKPILIIIFIFAIIIPCIVLSFLAIRSVTHEEAYIEKQISNTYLSEINYIQTLIQKELINIENELNNLIILPDNINDQKTFNKWK